MIGAYGILMGVALWWVGALAWLSYGFGRLLGAPAFKEFASDHQLDDRWRTEIDLSGDGLITITDASLWAGWVAYAPGDFVIQCIAATMSGVFVNLGAELFGSTFSALISISLYFLLSLLLITEGLDD
jgi:hypothetical protein